MPPVPAAAFKVREDYQAWVDARCTPHPLACFEDRITLAGARDRIARKTFVLAANYNPSSFQAIAERLRKDPSWTIHTLPCGHDTMVDLPRETADILLSEA
jgi:hypothetical protein